MKKTKECIIMKFKNNKKGFSFVEIIVAIAITLILSTLAVPKYKEYKGKALDLKAVDSGQKIYAVCIDNYINSGVFDGTEIEGEITKLLGVKVDELAVNSTTGDVTVKYPMNNKNYTLAITESDSSFVINDGAKDIYSSKQKETPSSEG